MKYRDEIIMNLKDYNAGRKVTGGTHAFESKLEELHDVYSQVSEYEKHKVATTVLVNTLKSKADEYEDKAKAFDLIVAESKSTFSCGDFCDDVWYIINNYERTDRNEM